MDLFDTKSDYEKGLEHSAKQDNSVSTLLDDIAMDLTSGLNPEYEKGYRDGVEKREK